MIFCTTPFHSLIAATAVLGLAATPTAPTTSLSPEPPRVRTVDVAVCLDTSGSMKGLIDSARHSIWAIVNDLALSKPTPKLRLALLTYGNTGHAEADGWVKLDVPLTDDLDAVSQVLFSLTTNGGDEYVGRVLQASLDKLEWSAEPDALKIIVVAGNEAADQDQLVDFRAMCRRAIQSDVLVNAIYCGNPADKLAPVWREVATLADGQFAAIDQAQASVAIKTPFDAELSTLSAALNGTYIPYGNKGQWGLSNQAAQDKNAAKLDRKVAAQRAVSKSTSNYCNPSWDLVDGCKLANIKLEDVKLEDLPENMRKMTLDERRAYVAAKQKERDKIQQQIGELNRKREAVVIEEQKKRSIDSSKSFDNAVRGAVRHQAEARGFRYQNPVSSKAPAATPEPKK